MAAGSHEGYLARPAPSGLAEVVSLVLDKGLIIDAYARISVVGIELLTVDARIAVAGLDAYLRFAEATQRLDLEAMGPPSLIDKLQEEAEDVIEHVAEHVVEHKVEAVIAPVKHVEHEIEDAASAVGHQVGRAVKKVTGHADD